LAAMTFCLPVTSKAGIAAGWLVVIMMIAGAFCLAARNITGSGILCK
jgi:hypothetical protein